MRACVRGCVHVRAVAAEQVDDSQIFRHRVGGTERGKDAQLLREESRAAAFAVDFARANLSPIHIVHREIKSDSVCISRGNMLFD